MNTHAATIRRGPRLRLLAIALAAGAAVLVLAAGASAIGLYADARGDSGSAPDIVSVGVTSQASGEVIFGITLAEPLTTSPAAIGLFLDTDLNGATGSTDAEGADYLFIVDAQTSMWGFSRWSGSEWTLTPDTTAVVSGAGNAVVISVNRSELGNAGSFNFWVASMRWDNDDGDEAPNQGLFNFSLTANGPDIRRIRTASTPAAGPAAGRPFVVAVRALELPRAGSAAVVTARPDSVRCTATLAGRRLAGRGAGGCSLSLPASARGKQLVVVVTVTYQGVTKSVRTAYRVR